MDYISSDVRSYEAIATAYVYVASYITIDHKLVTLATKSSSWLYLSIELT